MSLYPLHFAAARYVLDCISIAELKEAADAALDRGTYSHSLGELATIADPNWSDAHQLFERTLRELSIALPAKDEAIAIVVNRSARMIAEGAIPPGEGLRFQDQLCHHLGPKGFPEYKAAQASLHLSPLLDGYYAYQVRTAAEELVDLDRKMVANAVEWVRIHGRVTIDAAWLSGTVVSIARKIHQDHAFDQLPILADSLEDAGCDNADILGHLRYPDKHVHGCWVIDLLLAK